MNYFVQTLKNERTNINFRINRLLLFLELNLKTKKRKKKKTASGWQTCSSIGKQTLSTFTLNCTLFNQLDLIKINRMHTATVCLFFLLRHGLMQLKLKSNTDCVCVCVLEAKPKK